MIQRINDFDIPTFPQVGDTNVWIFRYFAYDFKSRDIVEDNIVEISHIAKWSIESQDTGKYAVFIDKTIFIDEDDLGFLKFTESEDSEPKFFNSGDDIILISDSADELKAIVTALYYCGDRMLQEHDRAKANRR